MEGPLTASRLPSELSESSEGEGGASIGEAAAKSRSSAPGKSNGQKLVKNWSKLVKHRASNADHALAKRWPSLRHARVQMLYT
jgi:hypothetical protein